MVKAKILIVEDEGVVAKDLQHMLHDIGYKVLDVLNKGEDVLDKVKKLKPNIILMDIVLKGEIDGIEAVRLVKNQFDIPVIYITAYADEEKIERAKTTQPYGYILKPFTKHVLKADIELALYNHKMVDELKISARKLAKSLAEREVMLKEIHHRVKNNMQIISSLLSLQSRQAKNKQVLGMFSESQARIQSMMLIHENLYESEDFSNIDFSRYIKRLMEYLSSLYEVDSEYIDFKLEVKGVMLDMNRAIPCGLILNELVINSLKYAFPDSEKGKNKRIIKVTMRSVDDKIALKVSDNGVGIPKKVDLNNPATLGLELVKTLVKQMGATVKIERNKGTTFTISFNKNEKNKKSNGKNTDSGR